MLFRSFVELDETLAAAKGIRSGDVVQVRSKRGKITGKAVVNMIITDLCVFEVEPGKGLALKELHAGVTLEDVSKKTAAQFRVAL